MLPTLLVVVGVLGLVLLIVGIVPGSPLPQGVHIGLVLLVVALVLWVALAAMGHAAF